MAFPESKLVLGKHSGRHALNKRAEDLGFLLGKDELDVLYHRFTALADRKKGVRNDEIIALFTKLANAKAAHDKRTQATAIECNLNILILPGDGIGTEVTREAVKVLQKVAEKFHHELSLSEGLLGGIAIHKTGGPAAPGDDRSGAEGRRHADGRGGAAGVR